MPRNANQSKSSNYSLDFGGSNQYISSSPTLSGLTDVTVSCWAKFENINNNDFQYVLIAYNTSQSGSYRVGIGMIKSDYSTVSDRYKLYTIDGSNLNISSFVVSQDVWYNIVVTQSGTVRKLFVNGDLISTFTGVPSLNLGNNLEIGRFSNNNHYFPGKINSVSIFDYALSSSQVTTLWGGGTSVSNPMALPSSPIAYYPLGGSAGAFQTPVNNNDKWLIENNAIGDYVFDFEQSSSQNIDIGSSTLFDSTSAFSFSTWCKLESYDNSFPAFIRLKTDQSTGFIMGFSNSATYYGVWFGSSSNFLTARTAGDISADLLGVWKHISLVYDGVDRTAISSYSLYINGVPQSLVSSGSFGATPNTNLIGQGNTASTFWDGEISNTQIWNTNLSSSEITTLYNYGSPIRTLANIPQNSNLKAWYKLDASEVYNSTTTEWEVNNAQSAYQSSLNFSPRSSSNRVNLPSINLGTVNSISFWCRRLDNLSHKVLGSPTGSQNDPGIFAYLGTNVAYLSFGDGVNNYSKYFQANDPNYTLLRSDDWIHFLIVRNGNTSPNAMTLYINEQAITSFTTSPTLSNDTILNTIGAGGITGHQNSANCDISNLSIFNSALGSTDANSLYNSGSPLSDMSSFSSLVSWWKLNNTTTGVEDSKGSNDGTNNGATEVYGSVSTLNGESSGMSQANLVQSDLQTVAPYSKYAMSFDAAGTDRINFGNPTNLQITSSFSVSVWINQTPATDHATVISKDAFSTTRCWGLKSSRAPTSNFVMFYLFDPNNNAFTVESNIRVDDGKWHHLTAVYEAGNSVKIYVDGSLNNTNSTSIPSSIANKNADIILGEAHTSGYYEFGGSISNCSIWNTALTSVQVTEIYNEGLPSNLNSHSAYSNLVSWWQLGENSSFDGNNWIVADEKGSNNGDGQNMGVDALVNGVGTTANGVSSGMLEGSLVGDAPYSTANTLSSGMSVVSRVSGVSDATITTGGTGYSTGTNIATTGGSGTNCTINITTVSGGAITAITINSGGNNYLIGDVLTVSGGNGNATITVSGLNTP